MNIMVRNSWKRNRNLILHICVWILYSSYIYTTAYLTNPRTTPLQVITFLLPFITTFYIILYCLELYKKIGIVGVVASLVLVFLVMSSIGYWYIYRSLPSMGVVLYTTGKFDVFLQNAILGYFQYLAYALLYFYVNRTIKKERALRVMSEEKADIERQKMVRDLQNAILKQQELKAQQEKLSFEYAFLRAQINPHFFYNTLNMLYSRAMEFSDKLAEDIGKLAIMMRYSMETVEYESDRVFIQKELDGLQVLLDIHNIRFSDSKVIDYRIEGEVEDQMLPPLSLITVVENAFKYGDLTDPDNPLQIKIRLKPRQIYFYCRNKTKINNLKTSNNIGITNLRKRLDISFKDKYIMQATSHQEFYAFELTINN